MESIHSKSGEAVEIFEARVKRVLSFLKQNIRPRRSHGVESKGEVRLMLHGRDRTGSNKGSVCGIVIQGMPFLASLAYLVRRTKHKSGVGTCSKRHSLLKS